MGALEDRGWSVWWDKSILAGENYHAIIKEKLEGVRSVVVLWSEHSVSSRWVLAEAGYAADREKLVPALLDEAEIPLGFQPIQTVRLIGWSGTVPDSALTPLLDAVQALVRSPTGSGADRGAGPDSLDPGTCARLVSADETKIRVAYARMEEKDRGRYVRWLLEQVESPGGDKLAAMMALSVIRYAHLVPCPMGLAGDTSSAVRRLAVVYLGELRARQAIEVVKGLLSDGDPDVRVVAREAHQKITGHSSW
ncbi:MAG: toll/interleukin-1 receptor domain-containing protein [Gemmatimonadales bacterium]